MKMDKMEKTSIGFFGVKFGTDAEGTVVMEVAGNKKYCQHWKLIWWKNSKFLKYLHTHIILK